RCSCAGGGSTAPAGSVSRATADPSSTSSSSLRRARSTHIKRGKRFRRNSFFAALGATRSKPTARTSVKWSCSARSKLPDHEQRGHLASRLELLQELVAECGLDDLAAR